MPLFEPDVVPQTTITTATPGDLEMGGPGGLDVLVLGMFTTPSAGTYLVDFSAIVGGTFTGQSVFLSIYVGGVQVANSERWFRQQDTGILATAAEFRVGIELQREIVANGAQVVEIRWRISPSGIARLDASRAMTLFRTG